MEYIKVPQNTIPTAILVFGIHTVFFSYLPGGVGGLEPSDMHRRAEGPARILKALRQAGVRCDRVQVFSAASSSGGLIGFIAGCMMCIDRYACQILKHWSE